jgi:L-ribulose-5-phosphate 3-epimerase UlaE
MKIGILQGRVLPDDVNKLQVFPKEWKKELLEIKKIGFSNIELLDDKENKLRNLLADNPNEFYSEIDKIGLKTSSLCADNLCKYSFLRQNDLFMDKLQKISQYFCNFHNFVVVVPFFDNNSINSKKDLKLVINKFSKIFKKLTGSQPIYSLEIDWPAKDLIEMSKNLPKNVGFCYDLGNRYVNSADLAKEIMTLGNKINHVHIKNKENGKNVTLTQNNKSYKDAFKALKKINYKGLFVLETGIIPNPQIEAVKNLAISVDYLKMK